MCLSCKNGSQLEKQVTSAKMWNSQKNALPLKNLCHSWKNVLKLEKCVKLGKCVTVRKAGHSQKNVSQLKECVTVRKCLTVRTMGHSYKYVSQLENMPVLENWVTTIKMAQAQLEKRFTVRKIEQKICHNEKICQS